MGEAVTDLLADEAEEVTTVIDFDAPVVRERKPYLNSQGFEMGVCRVCGQQASTASSTYCPEHKTRQSKSQSPGNGEGQTVSPSGTQRVSRPRASGRGAPNADEWSSKVFTKVAIIITTLYASSMVSRMGINDPDEAIVDALSMTDDEARRVAKPIGRFIAGTDLNKRMGRKVLDNSDLLDAAFALYDWQQRSQAMLKQYQGTSPLAVVSPIRPNTPPEDEATYGPVEQALEQPGIPNPGDFPNLSGAVFIP